MKRPIRIAARRLADIRVPLSVAEKELPDEIAEESVEDAQKVPSDWRKGALLNVRNYGAEYIVTLYPEEWDHAHPARALHFPNSARCQDFVSAWYARESHDPRAR